MTQLSLFNNTEATQISLFEEENEVNRKKIHYLDKLIRMSGSLRGYVKGNTDTIKLNSCGYSINKGMVMLNNKKVQVIKNNKTVLEIKEYEIIKRLKELRKEYEWEKLKEKIGGIEQCKR